MTLDDSDKLAQLDPDGMLGILAGFDRQLEEALRRGKEFASRVELRAPRELLFCGMGGSAVGADLVQAYLGPKLALPVRVCRGYDVPGSTSESTLAIVCSYSGNTEETLSCFRQAAEAGAQIVCVTSGGELARQVEDRGFGWLAIPGGIQPRAAVGFTVVPILCLLAAADLIRDRQADIRRMIKTARAKAEEYGPSAASSHNAAKQLAQKLQGKINVVHGSYNRLDAVARRWAGQLNENAKQLGFFTSIPEVTHNEIEGWKNPEPELGSMQALFLDDQDDHPRIRRRAELMQTHLSDRGWTATRISTGSGAWVERLWGLVLLGDYASVYLAFLNGEDPTPVAGIEELKRRMA